ncbi:ankyrin repeat domain-containing protein [Coxiella burnetii]|uniref:Surface E' protein n=2 Tax=Coxiella burnetii TaxID=777 RepID=CBEP_COXBE|nr:ankyrin repeat domain-containing protein [Coxiella burnetii]P19423.1 RecName: Full=Surface E' protein [Coxiella burnetii]AAA16373.1 E' protein [Coxiella burnetii]ACJ21259.1 hypothetical protein CbuK_A0026 [Coxiella burnetii CbuK_Q154]EAX32520.1 surface E' protein [Coxiella burnetii 'MSU Goat Q177']CAA75832.1 hypothetical protein [Coxiella burnetii]
MPKKLVPKDYEYIHLDLTTGEINFTSFNSLEELQASLKEGQIFFHKSVIFEEKPESGEIYSPKLISQIYRKEQELFEIREKSKGHPLPVTKKLLKRGQGTIVCCGIYTKELLKNVAEKGQYDTQCDDLNLGIFHVRAHKPLGIAQRLVHLPLPEDASSAAVATENLFGLIRFILVNDPAKKKIYLPISCFAIEKRIEQEHIIGYSQKDSLALSQRAYYEYKKDGTLIGLVALIGVDVKIDGKLGFLYHPVWREKQWALKFNEKMFYCAVSRAEKEKVFKPPYYLEPTAIIVDVTETPVKRLKNTSEDYLWLEVSQISAKFSLFCAQNNLKLEKADSKNKSPFVALSMESISELTGEQKRAFVKILNIPGIIFSSSTLAKARLESKLQYIGPALIEAAADGNFTDVVDIINRIEPLYDYKEILKEALKTQRLGTGNTPLQEAIKGQHTSLVKYFSSLSASLKVINHKNHQGLTALNFATAIGSSPAIVQELEWCSQ